MFTWYTWYALWSPLRLYVTTLILLKFLNIARYSFRNNALYIVLSKWQAANEKLLTSKLADDRASGLSCKQTSLYSQGNVHARFEHWLVKRDQTEGLPAGHVKASLPSLPVIFGLMTRHRDACAVSRIILRNSEQSISR